MGRTKQYKALLKALGVPPTRRKVRRKIMHYVNEQGKYLCNRACSTTEGKFTKEKRKVSCKNCLRELERK